MQTHHEDEEREAELRLIALKSAFLKKCEARKKKKMMERPYSPSDDPSVLGLEEVLTVDLVDNMEISPSLSPYLPDMEISNDDDEVCEMDLCQSSPEKVDEPEDTRPITPIHEPLLNKLKNRDMETDEEDALRSLLLAQVKPQSEKRDDLPYIEKNLKLAVLRLKQKQNKVHVGNDDESKAGIGELFADQRNVSDIVPFIPPLPTINTIFVPDPPKPSIETTITSSKTVTALQHSGKKCVPPSLSMVEESVLLKSIAERIISDPCSEKSPKLQKIISSPQKPINKSSKATSANVSLRANKNTLASVQPVKSKFRIVMPPSTLKSINHSEKERALISSSMTDTKNIPLLSKQKLKKQSKLITSLDDCNRIVERLVINLNESDESSDEASKIGRNKMGEKTDIPPVPKNFQNNLDVFLKNIRQTGSAASTPSVISSAVTKDSTHVEVTAVKAATVSVFVLKLTFNLFYI